MAKTQKREKIDTRLEQSMTALLPLEIVRDVVPDEVFTGIVLSIGDDWVLLAKLRDGGYLDGYTILRIDTIRRAKVERTFVPFLASQHDWPPEKPKGPIDLTGPAAFIVDIARVADVMSIYEEARRPDALWIGTPDEFVKNSMWFTTIDPKAVWDDLQIKVKLKNLTRIDFLDDYTNAIFKLAGPFPSLEPQPAIPNEVTSG